MSKYCLTKEYLNKLYWEEELSTYKIANVISCSDQTISYWMGKFGIRRRTHSEMIGKLGSTYGKYREGIYYKDKKYYCIECLREICSKTWFYGSKKCRKCWGRLKQGTGKKSKQYYCKCGNKIHYTTYLYGSGECKPCVQKGVRNYNYIDGKSKEPYSLEFNEELKEQIRKRDNYTCQLCGIAEEEHIIIQGKVLSIHHIDYDKQNLDKDNLLTLCNQCNVRVNYNRKFWEEYFQKIIENKEVLENGRFTV